MNSEVVYFDALKRITGYDSLARLRRTAQKLYGLPFEEALEYAYENMKSEAERAIRGKRRPKPWPREKVI